MAEHEVRARGAQQVLAPVVDVARDPRWGRIEETYGEDPHLVARMGLAVVRGLQGGGRTIPDRRRARRMPRITWETGRSCGWRDSRRTWCARCWTPGSRRCWC